MAKNITTEIKAENIGPHLTINDSFPMSQLKLGVFANNGSGKTFISRAFRLLNNNEAERVNKILTINKTKGSFNLKISEQKEGTTIHKKLSITLNKDKDAVIVNDTDYLFHVFNSDYVKDNIEELKYNPDGEIEGYILGKTKIDLTKEKKKVKSLHEEVVKKSEILTIEFKKGKEELDKQKINRGTGEYKFTVRNVYDDDLDYKEEKTYEELVKLNKTLNQSPDDIKDIEELNYSFNGDLLNEVKEISVTEYTKSKIAQSFKDKVISKQEFIESGLTLLSKKLKQDEDECPFCEQTLRVDAIKLIEDYNKYLDDSEALINSKISNCIKSIEELKVKLKTDENTFLRTNKDFNTLKKYIPSLIDVNLDELKETNLDTEFENIIELLKKKLKNIEIKISLSEYKASIKKISNQVKILETNSTNNNKKINDFNLKKDNLKSEKLEINRRLCKAMYLKIQTSQKDLIKEIKTIHKEKKELDKQIEEKESKEKVSKKIKVLENLKKHLKAFFGEKYSIDDDFCFKFNKHILTDNATDVLSDGEKSIVAFCYYLADIHKLVERDDDYDKLFFIIDDPISSLDFHYVYAVSQIIRTLHKTLSIKEAKFIVLTHNLEFMSILLRNEILSIPIVLANSKLSKLSRQLVMPYEEHLRDIYSVANGGSSCHTTPNSVRHVLETINKFESPDKQLKAYCDQNDILKDNEFVFSLMHDGSHGNIRQQMPYNEEMIQKGCVAVIDFINSKFEGQINQIKA
ncbi:AAA family ATPase [Flavivirga rizhaonensis]|uniref:Protein CR006 P-loop domain-containing protein n=1 Tax=Flavivirga rizhaonensis TaxID=2559571 RepID=A0A4S1DRR5_9FLAO|nr:AAA family ATPase [Flavivirga rizhaonensis]TGV00579.1 hypothetical protein EM932_19155 [Flavivirga rizhaonensis]